MIKSLLAGLILGSSAGFSPGPLTTLVITQTLQHGTREGLKVVLAPLVTDAPIVGLSLLLLAGLSNYDAALGGISLAGAGFVLYLAWRSFCARAPEVEGATAAPRSIVKGVLVNFLSPNPYIFWLTVGGPTTLLAWQESRVGAGLFVAGFYVTLVGGKSLMALLVGRTRHFIAGRAYGLVMKTLAALLLLYAGTLGRDGLRLMGVIT
jgi:threonine/homoserine/homoserine lactone efflux protein